MTLMTVVRQDRYGSPDVLRVATAPVPVPGENDVLVRVRAAAVNARDWHVMRGDPYLARLLAPDFGLRGPRQPVRGTDFAGTVEAVGSAVTRLRPGDQVYGEAEGAFAEYVRAPQSVVAPWPASLDAVRAAAVPLAANTALVGLRDVASVQPGQTVLVNGASGGVGTFAVQLAKAFGADVTAVCGTRNVDLVGTLGADRVVDYRRTDFTRLTGFDVVLDLVGNRSLAQLRRVAAPDGMVILSGGGVSRGGSLVGPMGLMIRGTIAARFAKQAIRPLNPVPGVANLTTLASLIDAGQVTPIIDRTYPLAEAADAIRYVEVEHARAKVVLTV